LGFFDFYIIPLAKKLADCGVFGVASDEYLNYAMANRSEWQQKGKDIVAGYVASVAVAPHAAVVATTTTRSDDETVNTNQE
jgi:hypothetical protein